MLATVDAFEAFAEEVPAKVAFETISNRASPPEGPVTPDSPEAALRSALEPTRIAQYTGSNEAPIGMAAATGFLFGTGDAERGDELVGDGPIFRVERNVGPAESMIGGEGGQRYRSLECRVRIEVHVPAHEGRPARVAHREMSYTPTSFDVEVPQVEGRDSTNTSVRHRAVYDSLLSQISRCYTHGSARQLAFYQRPQDYAAAVDMPIPVQNRALDAIVTSLEGTIPGVEVGTRCRIQAGRGELNTPRDCRVGFVCAGQELYGHGTTGFLPCPDGGPVIVEDEDANDGDPAIRLDTSEQKLTFRDVAGGRFGEVSLEARVIAIDEPTPQLPAARADSDGE